MTNTNPAAAAYAAAAIAAYRSGWNASKRTTSYDLDAAQSRFIARNGETHAAEFSKGWADYASDYSHTPPVDGASVEAPESIEAQAGQIERDAERVARATLAEPLDSDAVVILSGTFAPGDAEPVELTAAELLYLANLSPLAFAMATLTDAERDTAEAHRARPVGLVAHGEDYRTIFEIRARLDTLDDLDAEIGTSDGRETERRLILDALDTFTGSRPATSRLLANAVYLASVAAPVLTIAEEIAVVAEPSHTEAAHAAAKLAREAAKLAGTYPVFAPGVGAAVVLTMPAAAEPVTISVQGALIPAERFTYGERVAYRTLADNTGAGIRAGSEFFADGVDVVGPALMLAGKWVAGSGPAIVEESATFAPGPKLHGNTLDAVGAIYSVADLKRHAERAGSPYFAPATLRFFNSRAGSTVYGSRFFTTSERYSDDSPRLYSVREFRFFERVREGDGRVVLAVEIETVGEFQGYTTAAEANRKARWLSHEHDARAAFPVAR